MTTIVPASSGEYSVLWLEPPGNAPVVAWVIEDSRVVEGIAVGKTTSIVWQPDGSVLDLSTGARWVDEATWRRGAQPLPPPSVAATANLHAKWRVRMVLPSGAVVFRDCVSQASAEELAARMPRATVERTLYTPWATYPTAGSSPQGAQNGSKAPEPLP